MIGLDPPVHLFWPNQVHSLCGKEDRVLHEYQAKRDHVPMCIHYSLMCPDCLELAEIGPLEKGGNRCVPAASGYVVSERELPRVAYR